jgi:tetratricopeptide (TPR) repeat protein
MFLQRYLHRISAPLAIAIPTMLSLSLAGGRGIALAVVCAVGGSLLFWLTLPRLAHSAFARGNLAVAARRYAWSAASWLPSRRAAGQLSVAACLIGQGNTKKAAVFMTAIDQSKLTPSGTAAMLNNQAMILLTDGGDANHALALANQACEIRPDVPELLHTRARALLALGHTEQAIAILDGAHSAQSQLLEGERCADLAEAWQRKGQTDYASDYRQRALMHGARAK